MKISYEIKLFNAIIEMTHPCTDTPLPNKFHLRVTGVDYKAVPQEIDPRAVQLTNKMEIYICDLIEQTCTCSLPDTAIILRTPAGTGREYLANQVKSGSADRGKNVIVIKSGRHARAEISKARIAGAQIILCDDTEQHGATPGIGVANLIRKGKCAHLKALNKYVLQAYRIERELLSC